MIIFIVKNKYNNNKKLIYVIYLKIIKLSILSTFIIEVKFVLILIKIHYYNLILLYKIYSLVIQIYVNKNVVYNHVNN